MSGITDFPEDDAKVEREEPVREEREERARRSKLSLLGRVREFFHNIRLELRKTAWPTRSEVWSTTVVVLIAILFFGFYLWGVDVLVTLGFDALQNAFR